jgi:hypothetical protein
LRSRRDTAVRVRGCDGIVAIYDPSIMQCPLCRTERPDDATACTRCDWIRPGRVEPRGDFRNLTALWLSLLIPGLGHLYKGHVIFGGLILFVFGPCVLALALVVAPATLGLSLLILPPFVGIVMLDAYSTSDVRAAVIEKARALDAAESHAVPH